MKITYLMLIVCFCELLWGFGTIISSLATDAPTIVSVSRCLVLVGYVIST